eukprot:CAMPEP_0194435368 /NCGR_PEP_ID=MMETSP0176-20130528/88340_1 /TAXON_ID=216777 /ORGANISM="Proboscia alata, Strain PI-D3" /LENGTH=110 /DNA_ID=CAMNT_0039254603 /DNA_START=42 /DNA_END=370 /DNA_ORIENTATION=+
MPLLLLLLVLDSATAAFESPDSGESALPPRSGTSCQLLSREVLTGNSTTPAVHRLRLSLPPTARFPRCCDDSSPGMIHVRVKAPDAAGQPLRFNPYSAHLNPDQRSFDLV